MHNPSNQKTCIVCGKPSQLSVCLHCFMNYNYHTYEPIKEKEQHQQREGSREPLREMYDSDVMHIEDTPHACSHEPIAEESENMSIASWFARLPHFGT